jgi:hypothetical protein
MVRPEVMPSTIGIRIPELFVRELLLFVCA